MDYQVSITEGAKKQLQKLDKQSLLKVNKAIVKLVSCPRPKNSLKLKNREAWRIRIGDWRVIYEIDDRDKNVRIVFVAPRKDVYKHL